MDAYGKNTDVADMVNLDVSNWQLSDNSIYITKYCTVISRIHNITPTVGNLILT